MITFNGREKKANSTDTNLRISLVVGVCLMSVFNILKQFFNYHNKAETQMDVVAAKEALTHIYVYIQSMFRLNLQ